MKNIRFLLINLIITCCFACTQKKEPLAGNQYYPESEDEDTTFVDIEEAGGDSLLVGNADYSRAENELQWLLADIDAIKSTYMLQYTLLNFDQRLAKAQRLIQTARERGRCTAEELTTLSNDEKKVKSRLDEQLNAFSMPAEGVIAGLQSMIRAVKATKSHGEVNEIVDRNQGYFTTLPTLHLIINETSRQAEVCRLVDQLQQLVGKK